MKIHRTKAHSENTGRVEAPCETCGETFDYPAHKDRRFCSMDCRNAGFSGAGNPFAKERVDKTCEVCGADFDVPPSEDDRTYCSPECWQEVRSQRMSGEGHPRYVGKIERDCERCGDTFELYESRPRGLYCSTDCWHAEHSERWRGEDHPNWQDFTEAWLQIPIPDPLRTEIYRRDGYRCGYCGIKNDWHHALQSHGLHIHHITPREYFLNEFDDLSEAREEANRPGNLLTLCNWCHTE